jgi:hypothetical protein
MKRFSVYVSKVDEEDKRIVYADNSWRAKELTWQQIRDMNLGWFNKKQFMTEAKTIQTA